MDNPLSDSVINPRLSAIEAALKLDERLAAIEKTLVAKVDSPKAELAWWKKGVPVTTIVALIAAIVPLIIAIDGYFKNKRESEKLMIEQQDKIRQTYLDRVLKADLREVERVRIYNLLVKLKNDPELQAWAIEEKNRAEEDFEKVKKEKEELEKLIANLKIANLKSEYEVKAKTQKLNELLARLGQPPVYLATVR